MIPLQNVTVGPLDPGYSSTPTGEYSVQTALRGELIDSRARRVSALVGGTLSTHPVPRMSTFDIEFDMGQDRRRSYINCDFVERSFIDMTHNGKGFSVFTSMIVTPQTILSYVSIPKRDAPTIQGAVTSASSQEKGQKVQDSAEEDLRKMMGKLGIVDQDMMDCD